MYNTKYLCTYNTCTKPDLSDTMYRINILGIFGVKDYDFEKHESEIFQEMERIFNLISKYEKFMKCVNDICSPQFIKDTFIGFTMMFSYDFLYLTHPCISEFLETGEISDDKLALVQEKCVVI